MPQRLAAEAIGTGLLVAAVVGSGIMAEALAGGNAALALLANTLATAAALVALILAFGPVSGAHINPAVTLVVASRGGLPWSEAAGYIAAQCAGGMLGVWLAHAMFDLPILQVSGTGRAGPGQWTGEFVATFALVSVIWSCTRHAPRAVPYAVACTIAAGYWYTSSTSFANPAVALARGFTDSFSGIRPADIPAFMIAELLGAAAATALFAWFAADSVARRALGTPEPHRAPAPSSARSKPPLPRVASTVSPPSA
jgi:glycerol uptake facilitator-like aquaporin